MRLGVEDKGYSIDKIKLYRNMFGNIECFTITAREIGVKNSDIKVELDGKAVWQMVQELQKRYPNSGWWLTKTQREKLSKQEAK